MDKIAVCAIFKDEAPYLLEWLAFHRLIGVDLFVLYDNGSSDGGADLIRASSFARNVRLIDWPDRPGQLAAYNHFRINHAPRFTWVGFIDIDEFIMPLAGSSIRDILMRRAYEPYAQVLLQWLVFGPSGHRRLPDGLVIESYTRRLPETAEASRHIKTIVRADKLRRHRLHAAARRSMCLQPRKKPNRAPRADCRSLAMAIRAQRPAAACQRQLAEQVAKILGVVPRSHSGFTTFVELLAARRRGSCRAAGTAVWCR